MSHAGHERVECLCGAVVSQCRCPADKPVRYAACSKCKPTLMAAVMSAPSPPTPLTTADIPSLAKQLAEEVPAGMNVYANKWRKACDEWMKRTNLAEADLARALAVVEAARVLADGHDFNYCTPPINGSACLRCRLVQALAAFDKETP